MLLSPSGFKHFLGLLYHKKSPLGRFFSHFTEISICGEFGFDCADVHSTKFEKSAFSGGRVRVFRDFFVGKIRLKRSYADMRIRKHLAFSPAV